MTVPGGTQAALRRDISTVLLFVAFAIRAFSYRTHGARCCGSGVCCFVRRATEGCHYLRLPSFSASLTVLRHVLLAVSCPRLSTGREQHQDA